MIRFTGASRRTVLKLGAAGAASLATPTILRAASHTQWVRPSATSSEGLEMLAIYRKAVAAMWALPPDDPHNWFRYAMIHLQDCPHGNWWFFVWHRPYVANLERIVRIRGEDDSFAMPYWDWTADPFVPDSFFTSADNPDNALDPTSDHFPEWDGFENDYHDAIEAVWSGLTTDQAQQETTRGFPDFNAFWSGVESNFTALRANARSKTPSAPELTGSAADNVELPVIQSGLKPERFQSVRQPDNSVLAGFNSFEAANHHAGVGYAVIEGQPHNSVHVNLGAFPNGWMPSLLSSVDPIFFVHHCNIDRLWDVWTTKERDAGRTALPDPADAPRFDPQPFLFYTDAERNVVPTVAGEQMETAPWDYSYTPGSGAEDPGLLIALGGPAPAVSTEAAENFGLDRGASARIDGIGAIAEAAAVPEARQLAHVTFTPPMQLRGVSFDFFISPAGETAEMSRDSEAFAGSFEFFGMTESHGNEVTVTIDVTEAFDRLREEGVLDAGDEIEVTVVAVADDRAGIETGVPIEGTLNSVALETI